MENLGLIEQEFVKLYQKVGKSQGMDDLFLKIFAISYISPEDISLEELAEKTRYSLASISSKVKILETMGMLTKTRQPGSKKVFIKAEKNMIKMFRDISLKKHNIGITVIKEKIPEIIAKFKNKKLTEDQKKKLKTLQDYHKQILIMDRVMYKMIIEFNKALKEYEK